jgi:hypothetical protein
MNLAAQQAFKCETASDSSPATRPSVAEGGSGSGADDEAGSDGSGSGSETGSLAAARELGMLREERGKYGSIPSLACCGASAYSIFSEDEVRTSLADSEGSREEYFGGSGEAGDAFGGAGEGGHGMAKASHTSGESVERQHGVAQGSHAPPASQADAKFAAAAGVSHDAPAHRVAPPRPAPCTSSALSSVSPVHPSFRPSRPAAKPADGGSVSSPNLAMIPSRSREAPSTAQPHHSGLHSDAAAASAPCVPPFVPEPLGFGCGSAYNPGAYTDDQARRSDPPSLVPRPSLIYAPPRASSEVGRCDTASGASEGLRCQSTPSAVPGTMGLLSSCEGEYDSPRASSEVNSCSAASAVPGTVTVGQSLSCEVENDVEYSSHFDSLSNGAMDGRAFTPPVRSHCYAFTPPVRSHCYRRSLSDPSSPVRSLCLSYANYTPQQQNVRG